MVEITVDLVQGNTLARQIRDVLMDRILNGELPPGSRLKDNEVAALFGTSNTPVREALRLLEQDGLVEILPYRGCTVRAIDMQELAEIFDVRMIVEGHAARVAAGRLTDEQLCELQDAVVQRESATATGDRELAVEMAQRFHRLVVEATGNRVLARLHQGLSKRVQLARRLYMRGTTLSSEVSYRTILDALRAGEGERAQALIAEHIAQGQAIVSEALQHRAGRPGQP